MGCVSSKIINNISNMLVNNENSINEENYYNLKNNYILYSKVIDNKLEIYSIDDINLKKIDDFILSKSLLSLTTKTKNILIPTQNNIFKYKNTIYKFNNINKTNVFNLLIRKNIKNVFQSAKYNIVVRKYKNIFVKVLYYLIIYQYYLFSLIIQSLSK